MAFKSLIVAALGLATIASAAPAQQLKRDGCANPLRIIAARGSYSDPGPGPILSELAAFIQTFDSRITVSSVNYPAVLDNYEGSVGTGVADLTRQITDAIAECPDVKIALLGYSQGANVVGNALCQSNGAWNNNIKAAILYGDPTHSGVQTFAVGSGRSLAGMIPRYSDAEIAPYTDRIVSYCAAGDSVCASGTDPNAHGSYGVYKINSAWYTLSKLWFS